MDLRAKKDNFLNFGKNSNIAVSYESDRNSHRMPRYIDIKMGRGPGRCVDDLLESTCKLKRVDKTPRSVPDHFDMKFLHGLDQRP